MRSKEKMMRRLSLFAAAALCACDGSFDPAESREVALAQAPAALAASLASLDLPGCELGHAVSAGGRWRIAAHPADSRLAVLIRNEAAVCIDTPAQAREELARIHRAAGLETPTMISTPIDDDPVPIRGEAGSEGPEDDGAGGSQPPRPGGGASNPQIAAGAPVPSDDPVPIRSLQGQINILGTSTSAPK